ncbi:MAG: SRPBCC domain-containing protein [Candidatus Sericytochromatia bacterium]|nr:SRPBCC domain-containing protein [Candidatus Tanganyikabacteria bacterium]
MELEHITKTALVQASPAAVWEAWTTEAGARTFFAPDARIDLAVYGRYEMLFDLEAPEGSKGGEGCKVLGWQEPRMLAFSWNAPPHLADVREMKTAVVVLLVPAGEGATEVRLTHVGWGEGGQWDEAYAYFDVAWDIVMRRLARRFATGPIDWDAE